MKTLDIMAIPLTQGLFALVDGKNYERLSKYKWYAEKSKNTYYARRSGRKNNKEVKIRMHTEITKDILARMSVDHINRCGLDNREQNIRTCTQAQNVCNRTLQSNNKSGYAGVCWHKNLNKWIVAIYYNNRNHHLGYYNKIEDAAKAYDKAAKELRGEYARLNFPMALFEKGD